MLVVTELVTNNTQCTEFPFLRIVVEDSWATARPAPAQTRRYWTL